MSFFEDVPESRWKPEEDVHRPSVEVPEWAGPPRAILPGLSTERVVLFTTDAVAMAISRFRVFPSGLLFTASVFLRHAFDGDPACPPWQIEGPRGIIQSPDQLLRFGVLYSDGRKWTNTSQMLNESKPPAHESSEITLTNLEGSGDRDGWEATFWLWPLPPAGPLTFVAAWPGQEVDEVRKAIDADSLRQATADAIHFWAET